jgi:SAM-dependent methyltransferase
MFHNLARYYDSFVAEKDYRAEVRRLEELVRQFGRSGGNSWLDVACGTGRHLAYLRRRHSVAGIDLSAAMLRVARRRLPGVPLYRGDIRHFRLPRTFDVVTCLFGTIGHIGSERELRAAFRNLANHLRPGGVAIVEPWIDPDRFRDGMIHLMTYVSPTTALARLTYSTRRGRHSILRSHYLIGEEHRGVRHLQETDATGLLLSQRRLVQLMESSGLSARFIHRGLRPGFGLLLGVRPSVSLSGRK